MIKQSPISGFPEWLPEQKMLEQNILDKIRAQFELFGFLPIETRAIEPLDVLLHKGDDKEIYLLKRLHGTDDDEPEFGLHFDLTVPFARYVQEFESKLVFPFKRYQIQKVWRGERKQEGRYKEFYQCDIDVIGKDHLPVYFDAELAFLLNQVLKTLPVSGITLKLSHRKILEGYYRGLGIENVAETLRIVDKLAKIGPQQVITLLQDTLKLSESVAQKCLRLGEIKTHGEDFAGQVRALEVRHDLLEEGVEELVYICRVLKEMEQKNVQVDLSIARGLDYYTGTVYEGYLEGHEQLGAICSGGRYDNLASSARHKLPGVGVSIGITRILGYLFGRELLSVNTRSPAAVMIILPDENARVGALKVATQLRSRNISVEIHHQPQNFGKQMRQAEKRGIPYVWFLAQDDRHHEVKNLVTGEQTTADPETWHPHL